VLLKCLFAPASAIFPSPIGTCAASSHATTSSVQVSANLFAQWHKHWVEKLCTASVGGCIVVDERRGICWHRCFMQSGKHSSTYCWSMFQKSSSAKEGLWNMVFTFFISI
jgi:hypothetical protein